MARWTLEHNTYLSCLLDEVTGTEEMVKIRQDYCRIDDCITSSNIQNLQKYFTGSKAEGLDLLGSDEDYMHDLNHPYDIEVSESLLQLLASTRKNKFVLVTDKERPGFVLLKCCSRIENSSLHQSLRNIGHDVYLDSSSFVSLSHIDHPIIREVKIQGPSRETWTIFDNIDESGIDMVPSIRCKFWPSAAKEWIDRPRHYGWPSTCVKDDIVAFGSHLVPVGHPLSPMKEMQWRISFSVAERTLVWSFNHTQIQCYAVIKLILIEFIKVKSSEHTKDVLCSYFIKTFLFWQYEETDPSFWEIKNLRGCIMYLLREFYKCLQGGVLRHYFIPQFNLLEVKLTGSAQRELLQIFDIVIQYDLAIMEHCRSVAGVWTNFKGGRNNIESEVSKIQARHTIDNEEALVLVLCRLMILIDSIKQTPIFQVDKLIPVVFDLLRAYLNVSTLTFLVLRELCFLATKNQAQCFTQENKSRYRQLRNLRKNVFGNDISSNRLWCALFLHQTENYSMALKLINKVLSSIPPYVLFCSGHKVKTNDSSKMLYRDHFLTRELDTTQRLRKGWLFDISFSKSDYKFVPRAIQIELCHCATVIVISPLTFAYYLMFLCYQGLGQYDNRDRALAQLADTLKDPERCSRPAHYSYNIAGHCLLLTGQVDLARLLFLKSIEYTSQLGNAWDNYNSAYHYLSYM